MTHPKLKMGHPKANYTDTFNPNTLKNINYGEKFVNVIATSRKRKNKTQLYTHISLKNENQKVETEPN